MMKPLRILLVLVWSVTVSSVLGCGTSGSNPPERPELVVQVVPRGPTTFKVVSLVAGGVTHPSIEGKTFVANGPFNFIVENADPPYSATFERTEAVELDVTLAIVSTPGKIDLMQTRSTTPDSAEVEVTTGEVATRLPNPEVRFDICAPRPGAAGCFSATDSGIFGIPISGTVGDSFSTHILGAAQTPTVYFLEDARDSIAGVFSSSPPGQLLIGQLFLNAALQQTAASSGDLVIKADL